MCGSSLQTTTDRLYHFLFNSSLGILDQETPIKLQLVKVVAEGPGPIDQAEGCKGDSGQGQGLAVHAPTPLQYGTLVFSQFDLTLCRRSPGIFAQAFDP